MDSFSPYSLTPVQKPGTEDLRPVQDLHAVNSATVTLHPVVPNPYTLLYLFIPAEAKLFTCLDFKGTFSCICLAPQSQPIFAFQWKSSSTGEKGTIDLDSVATGLQKLSQYLWNCLDVQPKGFLG
jgi:hypothetical protein